jgi:hypothetical protein
MRVLPLQIGGFSLLIRSKDLSLGELASLYGPFVVESGEYQDLIVDLEQIPFQSHATSDAERGDLLAVVRAHVEKNMPHSARAESIEHKVRELRGVLLNSAFVRCLEEFRTAEGRWEWFDISEPSASFVDASVSHASIFLNDSHPSSIVQKLRICLHALLRLLLAKHTGAILHAAGIIDGDASYVFAGASGSGKTTIARSARELGMPVLADDGLILRKTGVEEVRAFRTPWNMFDWPWNGTFGEQPDSAPVRSVYFVRHSEQDVLERLDPVSATVTVLQHSFEALQGLGRQDSAGVFELLTALGSCVPCYKLGFVQQCSFWEEVKSLSGCGRKTP